jgi:hypothetical protein
VVAINRSAHRALAAAELAAFSDPFLLPSENPRDSEVIRQMMIDDIQPQTNIEQRRTLDLVELSWEILRYRRLKKRILDAGRVAAKRSCGDRTVRDAEAMPTRCRYKRAWRPPKWRDDPAVAIEIEARLHRGAVLPAIFRWQADRHCIKCLMEEFFFIVAGSIAAELAYSCSGPSRNVFNFQWSE